MKVSKQRNIQFGLFEKCADGEKSERQVFMRNDEVTDEVSTSGIGEEETDMRNFLEVKST